MRRPATLKPVAGEDDLGAPWALGAVPGTGAAPGLFRNGHALIVSSAVGSLLGMVFWVVAARRYSARDLGLNAAAISTMMFIAGAAQLNLSSVLVRFVPVAGTGTRRLVLRAYVVSMSVAAAASVVLLVAIRRFVPQLAFLGSTPVFRVWFVASTMAWCVFVLQDSVLAGLRATIWVPIENAGFSLTKIVLLLALTARLPHSGVFVAWTVAVLIAIVPTNGLIFRRLLPAHQQRRSPSLALTTSMLSRFVAGDYAGALLWLASTSLLPLVVTRVSGAVANAYFSLAWSIAFLLYLVSANMGTSLVVETATDEERLRPFSRRVLLHCLGLLVPAAGALVVAAPWVLEFFGHRYAVHSTTVLRLLALSAIPNAVNAIYVSVLRVRRATGRVVVVLGSQFVLLLGLTILLLHVDGINGVGVAWLVSQSAVAACVLLGPLRRLWALGDTDWADPESPMTERPRHPLRPTRILVRLGAPAAVQHLGRLRRRRELANHSQTIAAIVAGLEVGGDGHVPLGWTSRSLVRTVSDKTVVMVGQPRSRPAAVVKLPGTATAAASLRMHSDLVRGLHDDPRLSSWRHLLPQVMASGTTGGTSYVVERAFEGVEASQFLDAPSRRRTVLGASVRAISELHRRTLSTEVVDDAWLDRHIDVPLASIGSLALTLSPSARRASLDAVAAELRGALAGQAMPRSWVHGDFSANNIVVSARGNEVVGILDWERARPDDLPWLDPLHLLLTTRSVVTRRELGDTVCRVRAGGGWSPDERAVLELAPRELVPETLDIRPMALLCWLRHIESNLTKCTRFGRHRIWLRHNVEDVLASMLP
ncbi:MAG: phosphotransferase [Actinomycetota bacterium]|nr:phosphotransferase [Actinomycetota bacterium]